MLSLGRYTQRREQLVEVARRQRLDLVRAASPWSRAARNLDGGINVLRASPFPPAAIVAAAVAMTVWQPVTVMRLARRVWFGVKLVQSLRGSKRII